MEREERCLDGVADDEEEEPGMDRCEFEGCREQPGNIQHIQRSGRGVEVPGADEDEPSRDRPEYEIVEACQVRTWFAGRGDQGVCGDRRYLKEDVEVEDIARDRHADKTGHEELEEHVECDRLLRPYLMFNAPSRIDHCRCREEQDGCQDKTVETIYGKLDPERRRPPAEVIPDRPLPHHLREYDDGGPELGEYRHEGYGIAEPPIPPSSNEYQERGEDGDGYQEDRKMVYQRHRRLNSCNSPASSMTPYSSCIRTMSERPTAVTLTPTTIAVSMRTCGSGLT